MLKGKSRKDVLKRHQFADYLNVGTEENPDFVLMGTGFSTLDESPGAQKSTKKYVNEASKSSSITSYETSFAFESAAALDTVYVWYARYVNDLPSNEAEIPDIWQYTSTGRIDGVSGNVDMNCFYTDFSDTPRVDREDKPNLNIRSFQIAANVAGYRDAEGRFLVEDGIDGPKTQYVRKQIALKAKKSGRRYLVCSSGPLVKWWQRRCNEILGRSQKVDGLFGQTARNDTLALQRKLALKADGIAGYNSLQAAFYN